MFYSSWVNAHVLHSFPLDCAVLEYWITHYNMMDFFLFFKDRILEILALAGKEAQ